MFYTRRGCPLCDEMKAEVERARAGLALELVDVDSDAALKDRYGWRVPVLEIDGRATLEGRFDAADVTRRVARLRAAEQRGEER